jgi:hypothetical protein
MKTLIAFTGLGVFGLMVSLILRLTEHVAVAVPVLP